ncbi:hypothetical protein FLA_3006 [Filimonas lacunae]|nr:hypothetical protein FLA_3006 [Filimonas lacunae]
MDQQLTRYFELHTGIKVNKLIELNLPMRAPEGYPPMLTFTPGEVSRYNANIYISHNWNPVMVAWKSASGRIYAMEDTDIDCVDIEFWLEGMDPLLYHQQLHPKEELPFRLKNPGYELVIHRLHMDMEMTIWLKDNTRADDLLQGIYDVVAAFNVKSEKKGGDDGVVHSVRGKVQENRLILEIDTGSAGPVFLKALLKYLSKSNGVTKVEIGENPEV